MVKIKEFLGLSKEELIAKESELAKELFMMRNQIQSSMPVEKPHRVREARKDRARILMLLAQKQVAPKPVDKKPEEKKTAAVKSGKKTKGKVE